MKNLFLCLVVVLLGSGCAVSDLQRINRKLKDENDSLLRRVKDLQNMAQIAQDQKDDMLMENQKLRREIAGLKSQLNSKAPEPPAQPLDQGEAFQGIAGIEAQADTEGVRLVGAGDIFFKSGSCEVNAQGKAILDKVSAIIKDKYPNAEIRVFGHTDNVPVNRVKTQYPTNWELSCARASAVVRHLQQKSISPQKMSAIGQSFYAPVASNNSRDGKKKNRRVEILVVKS